ncbi:ABC transporter ATP-binding protein, partial [candidate division WWE3 bacterium]|nr:ABC transporter ATP-binding protein [candidate division WWE3 bacterium]
GLFVLVVFISSILDPITWWTFDKYIIASMRDARAFIFKYVQDLDFAFHTEKSTGALISAFKRGDSAFWSISNELQEILLLVINYVVLLISFWFISPRYAVAAFVFFVINLLSMKFLVSLNIEKRTAFNEEEDRVSSHITDNLINYDTVKFFAKEEREHVSLMEKFSVWEKALWGYSYSWRTIEFVTTFNTILGYVVMLSLMYFDIKAGRITIGDFVVVIGFLNSYFPRLTRLLFRLRNIAKSYSDIERYFDLLDEDIQIKDPIEPVDIKNITGEVVFKDVTFAYNKGNAVLKNINLTIKPGESVALVGRSGSGKTTMTKLLLRFFDPQKGTISIDGIDIKEAKKAELRSVMGVVPQEPIMFNNTIEYNIGYGDDAPTRKKVTAAAQLAHLHDFIMTLPKKYKTTVGERGIKLSGGQKQRLAIARMMMVNPQIIIFDEATSHLDSESEQLIQSAFWDISKEKTTIIIAHRLSTIQRADRIIVLDEGEIVEEGTHEELIKKKHGHYQMLWKLQTEGLIDR